MNVLSCKPSKTNISTHQTHKYTHRERDKERERVGRERDRDRHTHRETETDRHTETHRENERMNERTFFIFFINEGNGISTTFLLPALGQKTKQQKQQQPKTK